MWCDSHPRGFTGDRVSAKSTHTIVDTSNTLFVVRNGSEVQLQTLDYKNPGSNPVLRC